MFTAPSAGLNRSPGKKRISRNTKRRRYCRIEQITRQGRVGGKVEVVSSGGAVRISAAKGEWLCVPGGDGVVAERVGDIRPGMEFDIYRSGDGTVPAIVLPGNSELSGGGSRTEDKVNGRRSIPCDTDPGT
mgnify:CR=1 FL=1